MKNTEELNTKKQCDIQVVSCSKVSEGLKVVDNEKNIGTVKQCFGLLKIQGD